MHFSRLRAPLFPKYSISWLDADYTEAKNEWKFLSTLQSSLRSTEASYEVFWIRGNEVGSNIVLAGGKLTASVLQGGTNEVSIESFATVLA